MNDTVKGITPEGDREHIIHVHEDVEKLGGKIDKIYWVVITTVGAVGLVFIETLLGMI